MKLLSRWVFHSIEGVVSAVTVVMSIVVFLQVVLRYLLDQPFGWTEELGRVTFLIFVLLGAALAYRDNRHLGLDILENRLSRSPLLFFVAVKRALVILFAVIMIMQGFVLINSLFAQTPILGIPFSRLYLIFPITMILILIMALIQFAGDIQKILDHFKKDKKGFPRPPGAESPGEGKALSFLD